MSPGTGFPPVTPAAIHGWPLRGRTTPPRPRRGERVFSGNKAFPLHGGVRGGFPDEGASPDGRRIRQGIAQVAGEAVGHLAGLFIHLAAKPILAAVRLIGLGFLLQPPHFNQAERLRQCRP
jgi:hypothetical protein